MSFNASQFLLMFFDASWFLLMSFDALWCILIHFYAFWCILMFFDAYWFLLMSFNAFDGFWCLLMPLDASWCFLMFFNTFRWPSVFCFRFLKKNLIHGLLCTARPDQLDDHRVNAHDLTRGLYEKGYSHDPSHLNYAYS